MYHFEAGRTIQGMGSLCLSHEADATLREYGLPHESRASHLKASPQEPFPEVSCPEDPLIVEGLGIGRALGRALDATWNTKWLLGRAFEVPGSRRVENAPAFALASFRNVLIARNDCALELSNVSRLDGDRDRRSDSRYRRYPGEDYDRDQGNWWH